MARRGSMLPAVLALLLALQPLAQAQLSKPVAHDSNMKDATAGNKFLQREASRDARAEHGQPEQPDEELEDVCPQNIALKWHAEAGSGVYTTPLITDLFSDGKKDIVVPAFQHHLEVFEGRDGAKAPGFEAFHASSAHTSPLLYDIDLDGVPDIVLATYDGEIMFYKDTGEEAALRLTVPRLRVRRDWHQGLNPDAVDHTMPDVGTREFREELRKKQAQENAAAAGDAKHGGAQQQQAQAKPQQQQQQAKPQQQAQQAQQQAQQAQQAQQQAKPQQQQGQANPQQQQAQQAQQQQQQGQANPQQQQQQAQQQQQQQTGGATQQRRRQLLQAGGAGTAEQGQQQAQQAAGQQAQQAQQQQAAGGQAAGGQAQQQAAGQQQQAAGQAQQQAASGQQVGGAQQAAAGQQAAGGQAQEDPNQKRVNHMDPKMWRDRGWRQRAAGVEEGARLTEEAADSFNELFGEGGGELEGGAAAANEDEVGHRVQIGRRPDPHLPNDPRDEQPHDTDGEDGVEAYNQDMYAQMAERARMWQDDFYHQRAHGTEGQAQAQVGGAPPNPFIYIDAHILATPAIADLDGDGAEELVVAVSYFYDRQYYEKEENRMELGVDLDIGQYVASGVVAFDLHRRTIKWSQHLDLSTDYTSFKAYAYSPPTLADIDGDGKLEVILGTSMGFLYVLDSNGLTRPGFPLQMGDIQAQVAVADVNNDGKLELVAGDSRGNLAAFTSEGKEVWETHLQSQIHTTPVFGDVDGDGELELVVATFSGHVHVLQASTGRNTRVGFPFRAFGRIMAPPLLTKLDDPKEPGLQIAVTSFDGFLYVIDGASGCADSLDLGETSYAQVLADDLDGNGKLDLLVATANGNLYCIATAAAYHPMKSWPQQYVGGGTFTARWGWEGVYVTTESRKPRDVRGHVLPLRFKVIDNRPPVAGAAAAQAAAEVAAGKKASKSGKEADDEEAAVGGKRDKRKPPAGRGPYKVAIMLTGVGAKEMNAGDHPVIGMADILNNTGVFTMEIPCPRSRSTATIRVEMRDESRLLFVDEFSLSFHIHFYRLLKWLIAAPFAMAAAALLAYTRDMGEALPA